MLAGFLHPGPDGSHVFPDSHGRKPAGRWCDEPDFRNEVKLASALANTADFRDKVVNSLAENPPVAGST